VPAKVYDQALALAVAAHQALGCRGVSRADFRLDGDRLFILEVNTQPGMTPTSLLPEQAAYAGIPFKDLVSWIVEQAEFDR
jgi:D-alanine-D-alanine ligase